MNRLWKSAFITLLSLWIAVSVLAHEGPHGGSLYQGAGHKYHAELVQKKDKKSVTVYVLDGRAKNAVTVPTKTIELWIEGEKEPLVLHAVKTDAEKNSEFSLTHDKFATALDPAKVKFKIKVDDGEAKEFTPEDH